MIDLIAQSGRYSSNANRSCWLRGRRWKTLLASHRHRSLRRNDSRSAARGSDWVAVEAAVLGCGYARVTRAATVRYSPASRQRRGKRDRSRQCIPLAADL